MTTIPHTRSKSYSYQEIDDAMRNIAAIDQQGVLPGEETPAKPLKIALLLYEGIKPFLATVATLPILPRTWRTALSAFASAMQAAADDLTKNEDDFKAGKDL
jgi:hypothetical protein